MKTKVPPLKSGGLITNYSCTSSCRHCLYRCSPKRSKGYISPDRTELNLAAVRDNGCRSVHIGGGEPFVNPEALKECIEAFRGSGVRIDYIETNASWAGEDPGDAAAPGAAAPGEPPVRGKNAPEPLLEELLELGVDTLLISISPFHNEYVPFSKTQRLIRACRSAGMGIFPWVEGFIGDLTSFDTSVPHSMEEYEAKFGKGYLSSLPRRYWINMRGRALDTYAPFMEMRPLDEVIEEGSRGCSELTDTSHFHVDLEGSYIPGLCPGLALRVEDLSGPIDPEGYPILHLLMTEGPAGLLGYARREYDFEPRGEYVSRCGLCEEIRKHIAGRAERGKFRELAPGEYYSA